MEYAFQKYIDEQKHLDTDELRHLMKPICHIVVQDFKGEEHKYCDKEQLCPLGKFRRPKKMMEAESKGFATVADMMEAENKAKEDAKQKEIDELKVMVATLMAKLK
jgi:2-methylcitrate dehydratase PrpD